MTSYDNQSLSRGFKILDCLSTSDGPLSVSEVARRTGLHRATAHRILTVLLQLGYVHKDSQNALYSTAFYLHTFGRIDSIIAAIRRHAAPYLKQLSFGLGGERVLLGCLEGPQVVLCDVVAHRSLKWDDECQVGMRRDAHATALGKALMAYRPIDEIRMRYANFTMAAHGPRTVRSLGQLVLELEEVRKKGYAVDDGEFGPGVRGIAAPILNPAGRATCAIAVEGPKGRLSADGSAKQIQQVVLTARKIADYMVNSDRQLAAASAEPGPARDLLPRDVSPRDVPLKSTKPRAAIAGKSQKPAVPLGGR